MLPTITNAWQYELHLIWTGLQTLTLLRNESDKLEPDTKIQNA